MKHSYFILRALLLFTIVIGSFVCSYCSGQVRAEEFDLSKARAVDFLVLDKLATKWELEGLYVMLHDEMSNLQIGAAQGEGKAKEQCAAELREVMGQKKKKPALTIKDLLVVQEQNFGTAEPPVPQQSLKPQPAPQPLQAPSKVQAPTEVQAPSKFQAPVAYSCQPGMNYGTSPYGYQVRYGNNNQGVYSSGRGGLFQGMRARRQARRSAIGGMFGGCG